MTNENCIGCSLLDPSYYPVCFLFHLGDDVIENCPCINCLVKSSCSDICKKRDTFFKSNEIEYYNQIQPIRFRYIDTKRRKDSDDI